MSQSDRALINTAVDWDDRKTLAELFQDHGGRLVDLDEGTYDGLLAVARWGAAAALTLLPDMRRPSTE